MLDRSHRLTKTKDIERVVKTGRSFGLPALGVKALPNALSVSRVAVVAPLSAHKRAVKRNRAKRLVREALRLNLDRLKPGVDIVVLCRTGSIDCTYGEIEQALGFALRKLGLVR